MRLFSSALSPTGLYVILLLAQPDPSPIERILAEAAEIQQQQPERWQADGAAIEDALTRICYSCRGVPTRSGHDDLRKIHLARLVYELIQVERETEPRRREWHREFAFLDAIAAHTDERRLDILVEHRDRFTTPDPRYSSPCRSANRIGSSATSRWAASVLPALISRDSTGSECSLSRELLDRFATELPADIRKAGYSYIRPQCSAPTNADTTDDCWRLLSRLMPATARAELIGSFKPNQAGNLYIVLLLDRLPVDRTMADAARRWLPRLTTLDAELYGEYLLAWTIETDPDAHLAAAVSRVSALLSKSRSADTSSMTSAERLITSLVRARTSASCDALIPFANDRRLSLATRTQIVTALAVTQHSQLKTVLERWIRHEGTQATNNLVHIAKSSWGQSSVKIFDDVLKQK